jgi:hypothetical protein
MNKRGMLPIVIAFWSFMGLMVVAAGVLRPSHIINRANEKCIATGQSAEVCKTLVDGMSQAERIEYIRDK